MAVVDTFGSIIESLRTGKIAGSKIETGKVAEIADKIRALPQAQQLAEKRMGELIHERWVHTTATGDFYTRGTIAAEKLDPDS